MPKIIKKFHPDGFREHKDKAIELLRETIKMLEENSLTYFLISGTLLGYVRHNDFIPWDDDIDLMVEHRLVEKLPELKTNYPHLNFILADYATYVKINLRDKAIEIPGGPLTYKLDHLTNEKVKRFWPFIDLFTYTDNLKFFHKEWDGDKFFPLQKVSFLGLDVMIPNTPDCFLSENYGSDYLTKFVNNGYSHKCEKKLTYSREVKER